MREEVAVMCAMREPESGDVVDMNAWLRQGLLQKLAAIEAAINEPSVKAQVHDMRTELEARLYREHLKRDPTFQHDADRVREMLASDNGDRVPADRFLEWAEGIQPTP